MTRPLKNWGWVVGVAVAGAVFLSIPWLRQIVGQGGLVVLRPLSASAQWLNRQWSVLPWDQPAAHDRDLLQQQLNEVTQRLAESSQQLESARTLEQLRLYASTTHHEIVTASIIARSPDPGVKSLVIDRGSNQGLRPGNVVITDAGFVVGKITTTHQLVSTVLLITDRQSVFAARIQNAASSPGVVRGERGLSLSMDLIPKSDLVKSGQVVVTAGTEATIPPDFLIGTIGTISTSEASLFQTSTVVPNVNIERLRLVGVVMTPS